jgi:hypothetical protein
MTDPRITPTNPNPRQGMAAGRQAASRSNTPNPGQTGKAVGQMSSYGVAKSGMNQIRQGDIVRGEISDLRNNEITITLENNTVIKGEIADSSSLSIGQTAAFRLSSLSASGLFMEVIPNSYTETELTLINKALEEASLPATSRNQSAVKALMDNLMPINKQSIQQLMQQAYDLNTEDMESLCLMNRRHMTVTEDSVAQFSAYRNGTHQLLARAETFSTQLPQLLNALSENGPSNAVASFGEQLLSIPLSQTENTNPVNTAFSVSSPLLSQLPLADQDAIKSLLQETPLTEEQLQGIQEGTMTQKEVLSLLRDAIASQTIVLPEDCPDGDALQKMDEITQSLQLPNEPETAPSGDAATLSLSSEKLTAASSQEPAESAVLDEKAVSTASDPSAADETVSREDSPFLKAGRFFHNISDVAKNSFQNINQNINQMLLTPQETSSEVTHTPSVIDTLLNNVTQEGQENNALFTFFTSQERQELSLALRNIPLPSGLSDKILSGDASAKEVLTAIREGISQSDSSDIQRLFQTEVFQKLFTQGLLENFTITPRQLAKKGEMDSFYQEMERQTDAFEKLINSTLSGNDSRQLSQESHDMKSNIDFMKTLNETFGYMQLPLKLQNQNTHGDLYVYTKKDSLKQNRDQISLLLHLEMEYLGVLDVKLEKDKNNINANFKLDNEDSRELISRNTHILQDSLNEKGYTCQIQVQPLEQPENPVQDFLNTKVTTAATKEMKRFSFDIRA